MYSRNLKLLKTKHINSFKCVLKLIKREINVVNKNKKILGVPKHYKGSQIMLHVCACGWVLVVVVEGEVLVKVSQYN